MCRPLDLFIVNSHTSLAQAACVLLLLPVLASLRGIPPSQLPDYIHQGTGFSTPQWLQKPLGWVDRQEGPGGSAVDQPRSRLFCSVPSACKPVLLVS